jgi:hypothetical protein
VWQIERAKAVVDVSSFVIGIALDAVEVGSVIFVSVKVICFSWSWWQGLEEEGDAIVDSPFGANSTGGPQVVIIITLDRNHRRYIILKYLNCTLRTRRSCRVRHLLAWFGRTHVRAWMEQLIYISYISTVFAIHLGFKLCEAL